MIDPLRRKQLKKGLEQLAQEGTIQLYRPPEGREGDAILGAVGRLQLEVVKYRLKAEYDADVRLEPMNVEFARWISRSDGAGGGPHRLRPRERRPPRDRRARQSRRPSSPASGR